MTANVSASAVDADAAAALQDILSDPSVPVGSALAGVPETDGTRIAALREAHDYLVSRRIAADTRSVHAATSFIAELARVDPALAVTLRWHSVVVPVVAALPVSRARNALLGDVSRGDLLTWAPTVRSWAWAGGVNPGAAQPIGRVQGEFEVDDYPGLYDSILVWDNTSKAIVVIPTHRERLSWTPGELHPGSGARRWVVRLDNSTVHADDLLPSDTDPRLRPEWVKP